MALGQARFVDDRVVEFGVREGSPSGIAFIGEDMYMVGDSTNRLYNLNKETSIAIQIGTADAFGVSEFNPRGLAAIGDTLYMLSAFGLETLNTRTGVATRVGRVTNFGVNETSAADIAYDGTTLYMVGARNRTLYTLNPTTGVATRVGNASEFNVGERSPSGIEFIGNTLYMVGAGNRALYTVNTSTGIADRVGNIGANESLPRALAYDGTTMYMLGAKENTLFTLNTTTGLADRVSGVLDYGTRGRGISGLAHNNGVLYATTHNEELVTINTDTSIATRIRTVTGVDADDNPIDRLSAIVFINNALYSVGDAGGEEYLWRVSTTTGNAILISEENFGANEDDAQGLAYNGSTLYMVGRGRDALYTVNPSNGAATRVGTASSFDVGENIVAGIEFVGDTLYMVGDNNNALFTLNTSTGVAQRVSSSIDSFGIGERSGGNLAFLENTLYMAGGYFDALMEVQLDPAVWTVPNHTISSPTANCRINFGSATTGFTSADIMILGSAKDHVTITSVSAVSNSTSIYDITLSITPNVSGSISLLIPANSVTRTPAQNTNIRSPSFAAQIMPELISATFTGHAGEKTGDFSIGVDFAGTDAVTNFELTDINIFHVSGDTLTAAGLGDYTLTGPAPNTNNYTINFTPTTDVEGVFTLDIDGLVTVNNEDRVVDITAVQISYDTGTVPIIWTPQDTGGAASNPYRTTSYTFGLNFGGSLSTPNLLVPGAFVVTTSEGNNMPDWVVIVSGVAAVDAVTNFELTDMNSFHVSGDTLTAAIPLTISTQSCIVLPSEVVSTNEPGTNRLGIDKLPPKFKPKL